MLYIFWGLLNLFFFAGFFVIAYHAVKQIRIQYGVLVAFVFVCVLCSFITDSGKEENYKRPMHKLEFHGGKSSLQFEENNENWHIPDSAAKRYSLNGGQQFVVHKTLLFTIRLQVMHATEVSSKRITPVYAYSTVEGTLSGVEWEPMAPTININESGTKIEYHLDGIMKWKFLNMIVYSERKTFIGSTDVAK
jgi:hypothetical protein